MKKWKKIWNRQLVRPLVNRAFTRFILGLAAALVWNEFVNSNALRSMKEYAFLFLCVLFAIAAWMSYLRLDGFHAPQFDRKLFDWKKKKPIRTYGDISDHMDDEPMDIDDLEDDEQHLVLLIANGINCVIFLVLSFL